MVDVLPNLKDWALRAKAPFGKPANIRGITPGGEGVEVTIGIRFLASELVRVIARPGFVANSTEDIVLAPDKNAPVVLR